MIEVKILEMATATGNPHLLHLRCAYHQDDRTCIIVSPWCDLDLSAFLNNSRGLPWWTRLTGKEKLVLITNWMACLASGLSALHKAKIKHQDMKPQNVLLDANLLPVICDFGLSKAFDKNSKSVKFQGTLAYMPPEQFKGKVGRKGDIFSLGLIFLELGLLFYGQKSLKRQFTSGVYADVTGNLVNFLSDKFPLIGKSTADDWNRNFQELLKAMLDVAPENRPKASTVWEKLKGMVEYLGAKPHCEAISPVGSIVCVDDEGEDDTEISLLESFAQTL